MYLPYNEYSDMGGKLPEPEYNRLEYKAQRAVNAATFGRVAADAPVREAVKRLVFELVGLYVSAGIIEGAAVSSVSNDGYSETYVTRSDAELQAVAEDLITFYLSGETTADGTPLLYRGVC